MAQTKTLAQYLTQFSRDSSRQQTSSCSLSRSSESSLASADENLQDQWCVNHNPSSQTAFCKNIPDCYFGNHETLAQLNKTYGSETSNIWLVAQLLDLSEYAGAKGKISGNALSDCANIISNEYYYLKFTELMLFFYKFKSGTYGKFYGAVDPLTIMDALRNFVKQRNEVIAIREQEIARKQRQAQRREAISREEYIRRKQNAQKGT